jgi:conjugal transfer pilus assembly protein TraF
MTKLINSVLATAALVALATHLPHAYAQEADQTAPVKLEEAYGDAFVNYKPYTGTAKTPEAKPATPPAMPPAPTAGEACKQKVDVAWLRKSYPLLEDRAINDPSDVNVASYLYVRRIIMDKSQRFGEAVNKVTTEDPLLNENNRVPYASTGARAVKNANYLAEQEAVRELAKVGGLLIFVDGSCRFCAMQLPVASMVRSNFGLEYLVISTDGTVPADYKGSFQRDNGLYKRLGLKLTPSVVFVPSPKAYAGTDPNRYLVISQGFYAADELVKQVAFAGHSSSLLSKSTMAGLDIWDRGVASKDDLGALRLDVNRPDDIKQAIQPLLLKQY